MYVDDVQSGSYSINHALQKRNQLISALKSGGFELRKWSSNAPELLESIPVEHQSNNELLQINNNESIKTLGVYWRPNIDCFQFKINFLLDKSATKRSILSTIARLFDPLGFLAPVIILAKIILKDVWLEKVVRSNNTSTSIDWDEPLPEKLTTRWSQFIGELLNIEKIKIPRWPDTIKSIQLHSFCDGSKCRIRG